MESGMAAAGMGLGLQQQQAVERVLVLGQGVLQQAK
jgi:hypothetical protein